MVRYMSKHQKKSKREIESDGPYTKVNGKRFLPSFTDISTL